MVHVKSYTRSYPSKSRAGVKRKPEPVKKAPAKPKKKKHAPHRLTAAEKRIGNLIVPGVHAPKNDMKDFIAQQRLLWA